MEVHRPSVGWSTKNASLRALEEMTLFESLSRVRHSSPSRGSEKSGGCLNSMSSK